MAHNTDYKVTLFLLLGYVVLEIILNVAFSITSSDFSFSLNATTKYRGYDFVLVFSVVNLSEVRL